MSSPPSPILSNTLAQLTGKAVAVLLTLLSTFYFLRLAGADLFGQYSKVLALITIGFTAIDFGLNAHSVREMKGELPAKHLIAAQTIILRLLLSLFAMLTLNLIVLLLPGGYSGEIKEVFWLGSLAIIFHGLYLSGNAWFQRQLQYWRSTLAVIFGTTVGTILTLIVIFNSPTLSRILFVSTIGYACMGLVSLLLLPREIFSRQLWLQALPRLFTHLRGTLILGTILILSVLASKADIVILGIFRSSSEVGEYSFAYRIFDVALVLPTFIMNAVYPLLVTASPPRKRFLLQRSAQLLGGLGLVVALILYFLAPSLKLVRPDLDLAVGNFRLLVLSLPLFYLTSPLMWHYVEARKEKQLLFIYAFAAFFNLLANLFFVQAFGSTASSLLTGTTELIVLLALLYFSRLTYAKQT